VKGWQINLKVRLAVNINSTKLIYFSPTQTTKRILEGIAQGIQVDTVEQLDLTPPEARTRQFVEMNDELVLIGAPVYGGRIPVEAVHRLQRLKGNNTPAVVVVVYGNRAYEDALLELRNLAMGAGFKPVAGGTCLGEHSFSTQTRPIADGRPDPEDLEKAAEFGRMIQAKINDLAAPDRLSPVPVPGTYPYKARGGPPKTSPITQEVLCAKCETCAVVCPTGAITVGDTVETDQGVCIWCCACVKNCSTRARVIEDSRIKQSMEWLNQNCYERKEPEVYV
jgi:ferredoxin